MRYSYYTSDSVIVTSDKLVIGMADDSFKYRICKFTHNPTVSTDWCRHTNGNYGRAYGINLDVTSTDLYTGGYIDHGNDDKTALIMKIKYSDGSNAVLAGWL